MPDHPLTLEWLPGTYAVCRFPPDAVIPAWASSAPPRDAPLLSITRTADELSIVIAEDRVPTPRAANAPASLKVERGFAAFRIAGTLDFNLTGIIARIAAPLAEAKIAVFVVSTFDTDYVMVHSGQQMAANSVLSRTLTPT
jgi:hypothetical protein